LRANPLAVAEEVRITTFEANSMIKKGTDGSGEPRRPPQKQSCFSKMLRARPATGCDTSPRELFGLTR